VNQAIGGALDVARRIGHEALVTGVDLLNLSPVPGLNVAGQLLLKIWDAIEMVEVSVMGTPFAALPVLTAGLPRRIVLRLSA
jgi:hypothetical protein